MGKTLAIKGHSTRGKEVIELLKMMGGRNEDNIFFGKDSSYIYFIDNYGFIRKVIIENNIHTMRHWQIFTLEEFLEKYPFKVGDKVKILFESDETNINGYCTLSTKTVESMRWNKTLDKVAYKVKGIDREFYVEEMKSHKETTIKMNKTPKTQEEVNYYLQDVTIKNAQNLLDIETCLNNDGLELPNNVIINKSGIGSIEFIKWYEKPTYPKTYVECCEVMANSKPYAMNEHYTDVNKLLQTFQTLFICRNAYWKIAGEEMGLGKLWEPDLENEELYCIQNYNKQITKSKTNTAFNKILVFPTEEVRDAFYENFKDLIEQCKELL